MEPTLFVYEDEENLDWTYLVWEGMEAFNRQMIENRLPVGKTSIRKMVAVKKAVYEDPSLCTLLNGPDAAEKIIEWQKAGVLVTHGRKTFWELENELNYSRSCSFFSAEQNWVSLVAKNGITYIVNISQQQCFNKA